MKDNKKNQKVTFWSDMMSGANGGISSKRVIGGSILAIMMVVIIVSIFMVPDAIWLGEAIITMLIGAFSLLGIGVFEKRTRSGKPQHYIPETDDEDDLDDINNADI